MSEKGGDAGLAPPAMTAHSGHQAQSQSAAGKAYEDRSGAVCEVGREEADPRGPRQRPHSAVCSR